MLNGRMMNCKDSEGRDGSIIKEALVATEIRTTHPTPPLIQVMTVTSVLTCYISHYSLTVPEIMYLACKHRLFS
jgi:hypothetical protein